MVQYRRWSNARLSHKKNTVYRIAILSKTDVKHSSVSNLTSVAKDVKFNIVVPWKRVKQTRGRTSRSYMTFVPTYSIGLQLYQMWDRPRFFWRAFALIFLWAGWMVVLFQGDRKIELLWIKFLFYIAGFVLAFIFISKSSISVFHIIPNVLVLGSLWSWEHRMDDWRSFPWISGRTTLL